VHILEGINISFDEEEITKRFGLDRLGKRLVSLSPYIDETKNLIQPRAVYSLLRIASIDKDDLMLENGHILKSRLLAEKLQKAPEIALYLATVGHRLEEKVTELSSKDMLHSLLLDYLGTYAVAFLRSYIQRVIEERMKVEVSHFGPGETTTWDTAQQAVIFDILMSSDMVKSKIKMEITQSALLVPKKSSSGLFGQTEGVYIQCNFCRLKCAYRRAKYLSIPKSTI
jgi:hypothetical protein